MLTFGGFARKDQYNFYPSADPFADFSTSLNAQTITQDRKLTNLGLRSDISYLKGLHTIQSVIPHHHTFATTSNQYATSAPTFLTLFNVICPLSPPPSPTLTLPSYPYPIS